MESKRMLLDFLSLLLGRTPAGFFNIDEIVSSRWTILHKSKRHFGPLSGICCNK